MANQKELTKEDIVFRVVGILEENDTITTACEFLPNYASTFEAVLDDKATEEQLMAIYKRNRVEYINKAGRVLKDLAINLWQEELAVIPEKDKPAVEKRIQELKGLTFKLISDDAMYMPEAYFFRANLILKSSIIPVFDEGMDYLGILYTNDPKVLDEESK